MHFLIAMAATVVRPRSELWFLWALAVYFVLARLSRRIPVPAQLLLAASVSAVWMSGLVPGGNLGWNGAPKFYLFFLLGVHQRDLILWFAERSMPAQSRSGVLIAVWATVAVAVLTSGAWQFIGPGLIAHLMGLASGIALAVRLSSRRMLGYLGSRTLPIYLAHTPLIIILAWFVHQERHAAWMPALTPVLPVAVAVTVVPLTLTLHAGLTATPARVLYQPPRRFTEFVKRRFTRSGAVPAGEAAHAGQTAVQSPVVSREAVQAGGWV
jgi:peptidoglycan/LPS O-acetylase OafA/YrhL